MTANTFGILNILMKQAKADDLAQFLPEHLLLDSPHHQDIPLQSLSFNMRWLATIHPSWISVAMKEFPPVVQSQLLAWLPLPLTQELLPLLDSGVTPATKRCLDFGAFYLLDLLSKKVRPPGITEEIFLPASPFNAMLYYVGPTKMALINCLGLYTLAQEMRNVVDRVVIDRVQRVLSETERMFLNYCKTHPMKHLEPMAFLASWEEDQALRHFIHVQGLRFLARALAKEDSSFLWYFIRRLDVGRGYIFEKALQSSIDSPHNEYFRERLEHCISILVQ
ncbi:hypothetical protein FTN73_04520 [Chlamydia trachomatis]|uniref:Uncharacterized protein n=2 Tax=Chlamydia trachomatis TaxID=813 RepID=O84564_CHLTR|nr:hypothetical protein [Chlamydia trachomatis]NP_220075.1 hypothetical protein CT_560 [Chlamydia trachomatis D/UW-3/CX]AAC68162.1 hypothetical protein CT_560 [Chlamydia trachomatis D/UW-3/CX]AAX50835.1 hypothetical protein CTA_0610 [Chlamydia trachomatis A/HAR-13]ADH18267.1 hypothetical protein G9768_02940 [Chlamydia trachomatis G/9768]ADH19191.1 hypothetical protein G11222_02950 [Chlamydia trachomatis G/11222]ADH20115.1 hypothetical protein G11074_02945 [Chlamydia trachomatis G/11074]